MSNEQIIINKTEKPNSMSFRAGGTGTPEFKIYFDSAEDLETQLIRIAQTDIESAINTIKNTFGGDKK